MTRIRDLHAEWSNDPEYWEEYDKLKTVYPGSGNVFADLGLPDAEEALAKARLAQEIVETIERKGLSQSEAAEMMGLDQPKVSALVRGRLSGFSTDRLFRCLILLG